MLRHDQLVGYLDGTLAPSEAADIDAALRADFATAVQLAEFACYDSVLRTLATGAVERARIEQSVLASIQQSRAPDFGNRQSNPILEAMNDPNQKPDQGVSTQRTGPQPEAASKGGYADDITRNTIAEQMGYQGIDVVSRSPSKDEQVAKELSEEAHLGEKKSADHKPEPAPETERLPEQDNDYYQGMSP